jgi:hypothetical protein
LLPGLLGGRLFGGGLLAGRACLQFDQHLSCLNGVSLVHRHLGDTAPLPGGDVDRLALEEAGQHAALRAAPGVDVPAAQPEDEDQENGDQGAWRNVLRHPETPTDRA